MKDNWVTIAQFYTPTDFLVLETKLKDENVEYRVLDKNTTEVHPLISSATGGIKLQVLEKDYHDVAEILIDAGIRPIKNNGFPIVEKIQRLCAATPLLNQLKPEWQFITFLAVIVIVFTFLMLLLVGVD